MSVRIEWKFESLSAIADHLIARSYEIKAIHQDRKIDKARVAARAAAFEEIASMIRRSTINNP